MNVDANWILNLLATVPEIKEVQELSLSERNLGEKELFELEALFVQLSRFFPALERLDLAGNKLEILPSNLCFPLLKSLDLGRNNLSFLPSLESCPLLEELNLQSNQITILPDTISSLSKLTELNLSGNDVQGFPTDFCLNKGELDLSQQELRDIPEYIRPLLGLQILKLNGNKLQNIPEWLVELSNLQRIELADNLFDKRPKILKKMMIDEVVLSNNPFLEQNQVLEQEELDNINQLLMHKDLEMVRQGLFLWEAVIDNCELEEIIQQISLIGDPKRVPKKIDGYFSWTKLSAIFQKYKHCNYIALWCMTMLASHQVFKKQIAALKKLDCTGKLGGDVPEGIGYLRGLEELNLSQNELHDLPDSLSKLSKLRILNLSQNNLKELPESIGALPNLEQCELQENPLVQLPTEIVALGISLEQWNQNAKKIASMENLRYLNIGYTNIQAQVSGWAWRWSRRSNAKTVLQSSELFEGMRLEALGLDVQTLPKELIFPASLKKLKKL